MTRIWSKNQGFGREMKTRDTHIAYDPVACFYYPCNLLPGYIYELI